MIDAHDIIVDGLSCLTDDDVATAAKGALAASGLKPETQAEALVFVEASLRWAIGALATAPPEDLVMGAPFGGRGLRQEAWEEDDRERDGIEVWLRDLILLERGMTCGTCSSEDYGRAWSECHEIMEAAADELFWPLADSLRSTTGYKSDGDVT
jgi:hypothetical protein